MNLGPVSFLTLCRAVHLLAAPAKAKRRKKIHHRNSPGADKHPAFLVLIIVDPAVRAVCTGGRVRNLRDQLLSPDRHSVVVHEPSHQQASAPVEEEVRGELAAEIVHLGKLGF